MDSLCLLLKEAFVVIKKKGWDFSLKIGSEVLLEDLQGSIKTRIHIDRSNQSFIGVRQDGRFPPSAIDEFAFSKKEMIFQSNFFGKIGERTPLYEVGSPHGENPFMGFGKGLKEKVAYHKVEDGIPQKFQDLVRFF
jgi:hypothetical protein